MVTGVCATLEETTRQDLALEMARAIAAETHHQIRDLAIESYGDRLVLSGRSSTYYVKQLATRAARQLRPQAELINEICVGSCR